MDLTGYFGGWIGCFSARIGSGRFENLEILNRKRWTASLWRCQFFRSVKMKKAPRPAEAGRGAMLPFMIERRCCVYWFRGASKFAVVHGFKHEAEAVFLVRCIDAFKPSRFQHGLDLHGAAFHLLTDCDRTGHQCLERIRGGDESLRSKHKVVECFLWKDEGLHQKAVSADHLQALFI